MRRWIIFISLMAMVFSIGGCSGPGKEIRSGLEEAVREATDADRNEVVEEPVKSVETGSEAQDVKDFFKFNSSLDFAINFQELEYSYSVTRPDGTTRVSQYTFSVLNEKNVNDVKAYEIQYVRSGDEEERIIECWVSEDEQIIEGTIDGVPREGADIVFVNAALSTFMMPFILSAVMETVITNPNMRAMMGWEIINEGTKTVNLGEGSTTIRTYDLVSRSDEKSYFEVATIGGKSLFVNYQNTNQQGNIHELNVTRLIPR